MSTLTSDVKEPAVNVDLPEEEEVDSQHGSGTPKSYKSSLNLQPEASSDSELPNHRLGLHKTVSSPKFTPGHDPEFDEINTRLKSLTQHAHSFHDLPVTSIPTPPGFDEPAFEEPWMKNLDDTEINSMFKSLDLKARKNSKHEGINGVRRWTTEVPSMDPTGKDGKIPSNNFVPSSQPFPDFGGNSTTAKLDSGLLGLDSGSRSFSRHNSGSSVRSPLLERSPAAEHKPHTIPDLPRLPTTPVMGDQYMEIHRLKTEEQMLEERIRQLQMRRQQIGFAPPQAQNQNQSQNGYPSSEYDPWESAYINNYMTTLNPPIPYGHNSLLNNPDIMNTMQNQSLAAAVLSKRIRNNQSQPYAATPTAKPTATTGPVGANLFVFNFPRHFTDQDLCREFTPFGNVLSATVFIDKATGRSKCFGFVSFDNVESAQKAIQTLNGCMMGGKNIKVQLKRESSGAGSGQGGGQGGMSGGVYNGGYGQPQQQPHQAYNQGYGGQNNMYGYGFEK